jgi:formamidopyrimidine-DNA glycosylase
MPELPDLEVFSRNLEKKLKGKKLEKLTITRGARTTVPASRIIKTLTGQRVKKIYREGKELRFAFEKNLLGIHLMLRGKLFWFDAKNPHKHTLVEFYFEKDTGLAMTDYQRKAQLSLDPGEPDAPDALSSKLNLGYMRKILEKKAIVKNLLTDQQLIRGIGNAYADEILWKARISPFSISNKIPPVQVKILANSIKTVLKKAQEQIAKSEPGIIGGEVRHFMAVHNAKRKRSPKGALIKTSETARKTYYTNEQVLYR